MSPPDLNKAPLEELAQLPDWMVPPSRKSELDAYKARKRRGVTGEKSAEQKGKEAEEARKRAGLNADGSKPSWIGVPERSSPQIKNGPRGGRYTDDVTKDGRPYRRYF